MTPSPAGVRVGVDIGGTFTDIVVTRPDGTLLVNKTSSTPDDPARAVVAGLAALLRDAGHRPRDGERDRARNHGGLERGAAEEGRAHGAPHHARLPRRARDRAHPHAGPLRSHLGQARAPGGAAAAARGGRADGGRRQRGPSARSRQRARRGGPAGQGRRGGDRRLLHQLLREPGPRARDRAAHPPAPPGPGGVGLLPRAAGDQGVRAHQHHGGERLSPAHHARATSTTSPRGCAASASRRRSWSSPPTAAWWGHAPPPTSRCSACSRDPRRAWRAPLASAASTGAPNLIAFDMGGTTAKASLVEDGRVSLTSEYEFRDGISTPSRFIKAGGYMLKVPAIDIAEVGAGAGSIALDRRGRPAARGPGVGGRDPGPACYGLGGTRPTVTDANVALGFLNPEYLAGGELKLDAARAETAIREQVAGPLGLSLDRGRPRHPRGGERQHGARDPLGDHRARARSRASSPWSPSAAAGPCTRWTWRARWRSPGSWSRRRRACSPRWACWPATWSITSSALTRPLLAPRRSSRPIARPDELVAEGLATLRSEGYPDDRVRLEVGCDLRYAGQASRADHPAARRPLRRGRAAAAAGRVQRGVPRHLRRLHRRGARAGEPPPRRHRYPAGPARLPRGASGGERRGDGAGARGRCPSRGGARPSTRRWCRATRSTRHAPRPRHRRDPTTPPSCSRPAPPPPRTPPATSLITLA